MMTTRELIGCRVFRKNDGTKENIGKIVGSCTRGQYHHPYFIILTIKGNFLEIDIEKTTIDKDDFNKIYNTIKPEPIESRLEILDL